MSDAQASARAFRAALGALSRPGKTHRLSPSSEAPAPLSPAATTLLTLLADADADIWLAPSRRTPDVEAHLRFQSGAPLAASADAAPFLCGRWSELVEASPAIGTPERPDLSATLLVEVDAVSEAPADADTATSSETAAALRLSGPGVDGAVGVRIEGVDPRFAERLAENGARFPLGVDFILCAGDAVLGLPRTIKAEPL